MISTPYKENCPELFEFSNKEKKIWRYMDLAKFISLLEFREIYFVRGDRFEDKLEGSYSKPTIENLDQQIQNSLNFGGIQLVQEEIRNLVNLINQINRLSVFISCWHMNEHESYAMWDLYSKDEKGIAIQSTIDKIEQGLDTDSNSQTLNITAGKIHYLDFDKEEFKYVHTAVQGMQGNNLSIFIEPISAFLHKRISFSHEREMRFFSYNSSPSKFDFPLPQQLIHEPTEGQVESHELEVALKQWLEILTEKLKEMKQTSTGLKVKIKHNCMADLIEKVYISPRAPQWFSESLAKGIINRYNLSYEVKKSDLNTDPLF